ncbi:DnaJ domain-containing protein [Nocardioides sp. BP30]|uniref:J domain-containing protein n=1 Tax=Nocardioides sp. BP30 TaxID=3036374 RepID=UPI00246953B2|nr:DnaJ domain-containing protein [Nocardioides sp. BP30]WGL54239.1 DnaJ domain-containing protein [Nocardioides sp. BP30]
MPSPTWYDLLGVEPSADAAQIRTAWRNAIADLDPTERRFATLNEAAAVLLDPARRSAYDEQLGLTPEPAVERTEEPAAERVEPTEPADESTPGPVDEETSDGTSTGSARSAPFLVPGWVLAVVAVVALATAVLAGVLSTRHPADRIVQADTQLSGGSKVTQIEDRAVAAQAAAKEAIVPVLSYDYRKLDADQKTAESYLTDSYRKTYDKTFALIKKSAPGVQTVVTTKVVDTGIIRVDDDRVQVLLFVDRPTTNKATTTAIPYQDQVTATMEKVGGDWLIDNLVTTPIAP